MRPVVGTVGLVAAPIAAVTAFGPGADSAPSRAAGARPQPSPCSGDYARGPYRAGRRLCFGIDPEPAGSAGSRQIPIKPVDKARTLRALGVLRPPGKELVLRVNRLFEADGRSGIARLERIVNRYTRAGFDIELQVRYHPTARLAGDIGAWTRYVRRAVDVFGPDRQMMAMRSPTRSTARSRPTPHTVSIRGPRPRSCRA